MIRMLRKTWPWALGLGIFYLAPLPLAWAVRLEIVDAVTVKGLWLVLLVAVNPAVTVLAAGLVGYRHGFAWVFAPLAAVAWIPAMYLVYNDSALIYGVFYIVFALVGLGAGVLVRSLARKSRPA